MKAFCSIHIARRCALFAALAAVCVIVGCSTSKGTKKTAPQIVLASWQKPAEEPPLTKKENAPPRASLGLAAANTRYESQLNGDSVTPPDADKTPTHGMNTAPKQLPIIKQVSATVPKTLPVDLTTALKLAGANNRQIALTSEKIREAQAQYQGAKVLWLPTVSAGLGYNKHEGRIQATNGDVMRVSRSSVFVGGGASPGGFPITGGSGGPARFAVDFSVAEGIFEPLAKCQLVRAAHAARDAEFNATLRDVARVYLDLIQARGELSVAMEAAANARKLVNLVDNRVRAGLALPVDAARVTAESERRRRDSISAEIRMQTASAELTRLLALDPSIQLLPLESHAVPICLVPQHAPLDGLIAQAMSNRPELAFRDANVQIEAIQMKKEHWRPFIPHLHVGTSTGGFGGGRGTQIGNFGGRFDFDALMIWELRNLGYGNRSLYNQRASRRVQAVIRSAQARDFIAKEVSLAWRTTQLYSGQMAASFAAVQAAAKAVPLNFQGILGGEIRAVEAQQAIDALARARRQQLQSVVDYNRSQFELLYAIGRPLQEQGNPGEAHP